MKTLVHLSDLHFGRVDHALVEPLVEHIITLAPDVVVVSGDLTQRARSEEFRQARAFLARLPGPQVVVPGNHDVPLYNIIDRFLRPLDKFRRFITHDLSPSLIDDELAVLGVNTARSLVMKNGRINDEQLAALRGVMQALPADVVRVVVTHHPFDVAANVHDRNLIGRADQAMKLFAEHSVDVLLAGHLHTSHSANTGLRYALGGYEALVVSAGTATSTRGRGEANSFNVLRLDKQRVEVDRMEWTAPASRFVTASSEVFERTQDGWREVK
ncbi:MAG: metallophosphoesterase [Bdellovibrionales bacterium]|nr:metallophosphoesterase [Ramlibacter sp.]